MSRWWHKVQQALPKPSSLKKTASENVSFVQKKYGGVAKDKVDDLKKKGMAMHNGKQLTALAREWAQEATSRLGKRVADNARALPSKAAEVSCLELSYGAYRIREISAYGSTSAVFLRGMLYAVYEK